jgi:hypothetical protein
VVAVGVGVGRWVSSNSSVVDSALNRVSRGGEVVNTLVWEASAGGHAGSSVSVLGEAVLGIAVLHDQVAVYVAEGRTARHVSRRISVVAVGHTEDRNSGVVVESASQGVAGRVVEGSRERLQVGVAVVHASSGVRIDEVALWIGEELLAVVLARVGSALLGSVWRSVGAVNLISLRDGSLGVVQSAGKGVSVQVVTDGSLLEEGGANGDTSSLTSSVKG